MLRAFPVHVLLFLFVAVVYSPAQAPLHHWNCAPQNWSGRDLTDLESARVGRALHPPQFDGSALVLRGKNRVDIDNTQPADLPREAITVETVFAVDRPDKWGMICGFLQDNGNYEKGWRLGYDPTRFIFEVATGEGLKRVFSTTPYQLGEFAHVVGRYDGQSLELYVNGKREARSDAAKGPIDYPPIAFYTLGAYRDDNEIYPMHGKIRDVRVYDQAIDPAQIALRARIDGPGPQELKLSVSPMVQFRSPTEADIRWRLEGDTAPVLLYGPTRKLEHLVAARREGDDWVAAIPDLPARGEMFYRIGIKTRSGRQSTPVHRFECAVNYATHTPEAKKHTPEFQTDRGMALVIGLKDGKRLEALARETRFHILAVDTDSEQVQSLRQAMYKKAGDTPSLTRIQFMHVPDLADLPMTPRSLNLIVSERPEVLQSVTTLLPKLLSLRRGRCVLEFGTQATDWIEAGDDWRVENGTAICDVPSISGTSDWTHQYGNAGNWASNGETLSGAKAVDDLVVQWVGRPGGNFGIDRQPRMPAPLSCSGRLFHQGMNRMVALDSSNGSILWNAEIPNLRRLNMPRDCGNWCAAGDDLFVAIDDQAWVFDAENGTRRRVIPVPETDSGSASAPPSQWGWIAIDAERLYGSRTASDAAYQRYWGKQAWFDGKKIDEGTAMVCGDALFAIEPSDGKLVWRYANGLILHSTLCLADDRITFLACRQPDLISGLERRINSPELWQDTYLVCLQAANGNVLWERPVKLPGGIACYLQAHPKALLLTLSNQQFHFYAFQPKNGNPMWQTKFPWPDDHHSGHIQHPVIVQDRFYLEPSGYELTTGKRFTTQVGRRSGCHTYIGCANALIYRGAGRQVAMWDLKQESVTTWSRLRPSCWLSFVAAGGMLQVPEGGAGCSCGNWMETSLAFIPRKWLEEGR